MKKKTLLESKKTNFLFAIITGLLGCALWDLFFSRWLTSSILCWLETISSGITDSVYALASDGFNDYTSLLANNTIQILLGGMIVSSAVGVFIESKQRLREINKINTALDSMKEARTKDEKFSEEDEDSSFDKETADIKKEAASLQLKCERFHKCSVITVIIAIAFTLCVTGAIVSLSAAHTIKTKTLGNIEIISPYITDQEYKQFRSDYYSMNSKDEYDLLEKKITQIAIANDLKLKK